MDKGAGGRAKRILSWILAALIITGGAIAIGWFAGIALVDLMEPGSKELAEQMDELNAEAGGQDAQAGAEEAQAEQQESPQLSLPSIMDEAFEGQEDEGSSPFASPPWANNVSITPIDEVGNDPAGVETGQELAAVADAQEPLQQQALPPADALQANAQINTPEASQESHDSSPQAPASQPSADAVPSEPQQQTMYKVRVGPYAEKAAADEASVKLKEMGLPVLTVKDGTSYFVQVGAFSVWANADSLVQKVKASGFSAKIAN